MWNFIVMIVKVFWPLILVGVIGACIFGWKEEVNDNRYEMEAWDLEMYDE